MGPVAVHEASEKRLNRHHDDHTDHKTRWNGHNPHQQDLKHNAGLQRVETLVNSRTQD